MVPRPYRVAEFFAGVGLVRFALRSEPFEVVWSNDIEPAKREMFVNEFGEDDDRHRYVLGDIGRVVGADLPEGISLAWASFPCTDLSVAGDRRGLAGSESGTFFEWIRILREMGPRRPPLVAAENVVGFATSRDGQDLRTAVGALNELEYSVDLLALDGRRFVAQSRPRLFLVGSSTPPREDSSSAASILRPDWLDFISADRTLRTHRAPLAPPPPLLATGFSAVAERVPSCSPEWWDERRTQAFIASLSDLQADRLEALRNHSAYRSRTAYRRTRRGVATWEIRADDIAGCLRTARGGSSRQAVVRAGRGTVRLRWMTGNEYATLMGAPEYRIDGLRPLQVLHGFGDAVCVPVVRWLAEHYFLPALAGRFELSEGERRHS